MQSEANQPSTTLSKSRLKRCSYYQNQGHSTEEWTKVKDFIQKLIQLRALARFVYNAQNGQG